MAAPRLSDAQKQELLGRFRDGENTQVLADQYGCSANTVTRIVKGLLSPLAYEDLKRSRQRRAGGSVAAATTESIQSLLQPELSLGGVPPADDPTAAQGTQPSTAIVLPAAERAELEADPPRRAAVADATGGSVDPDAARDPDPDAGPNGAAAVDGAGRHRESSHGDADRNGRDWGISAASERQACAIADNDLLDDPGNLGTDDLDSDDLDQEDPEEEDLEVDDLVVDDLETDDLETDDLEEDDFDGELDDDDNPDQDDPVGVPHRRIALSSNAICDVIPWSTAKIPDSGYLLVDKTVELQAQPLSEIPELGSLAPEEQQRQALVVYTNPRQAKRLCGRSQRVIKLPDTQVLARTAPYLLAQGISRIVIEGSLYALPER